MSTLFENQERRDQPWPLLSLCFSWGSGSGSLQKSFQTRVWCQWWLTAPLHNVTFRAVTTMLGKSHTPNSLLKELLYNPRYRQEPLSAAVVLSSAQCSPKILNFTDFFQSSRGRLRAANHLDIFWNLYFTTVCTERTTLVFISNLPVEPARQLRFFWGFSVEYQQNWDVLSQYYKLPPRAEFSHHRQRTGTTVPPFWCSPGPKPNMTMKIEESAGPKGQVLHKHPDENTNLFLWCFELWH